MCLVSFAVSHPCVWEAPCSRSACRGWSSSADHLEPVSLRSRCTGCRKPYRETEVSHGHEHVDITVLVTAHDIINFTELIWCQQHRHRKKPLMQWSNFYNNIRTSFLLSTKAEISFPPLPVFQWKTRFVPTCLSVISHPSTSLSGSTALVTLSELMGLIESRGSCTMSPWTSGSSLNSFILCST